MKYDLEDVFNLEKYAPEATVFDSVVRRYNIRDELFFPNYQESPWHVQWRPSDDIEVNFWPHKCKGHIAYTRGPAAEGVEELQQLICEVFWMLQDQDDDEDLIE